MKFSTPQSEISLRAYRLEDTVVFEIEDEGIGVTESVVDSLFTRFGRVHDSSSSTARGHGIGLYMSKVLIEKMGGTIGYRPREEGTGSVFWFCLQTDTSAEPAARADVAS